MQPPGFESDADAVRLATLDAVAAGIERRDEVLRAAYEASNREELIAMLQDLLAVDRSQALAIGDLQIFRFTAEDRARIDRERSDLRARGQA
jgi:DNA gyrase/topoisomerase IV subunit A